MTPYEMPSTTPDSTPPTTPLPSQAPTPAPAPAGVAPDIYNNEYAKELLKIQEALNKRPGGEMIRCVTPYTGLTEFSSQAQLLGIIFTMSKTLGNQCIDTQIRRHPMAIEKERQLYCSQPGLMPLLAAIHLDQSHPMRHTKVFQDLRRLIDNKYPQFTDSVERVNLWAQEMDQAVTRFLDVSLCLAVFRPEPRMEQRLDPNMFSVNMFHSRNASSLIPGFHNYNDVESNRLRIIKIGANTIGIHGSISGEHEKLLIELAKGHKWFIARKMSLLAKIESSPKFVVGMLNTKVLICENPPMYLSYKLTGSTLNCPINGVDFKDLLPVVCVLPSCHTLLINCCYAALNQPDLFVRASSAHILGSPPLAVKNAVSFYQVKQAVSAAKLNDSKTKKPGYFNPFGRINKKAYRSRKFSVKDGKITWDKKYLRYIVTEFQKKDDMLEKLMRECKPMQKQKIPGTNTAPLFDIDKTCVLFLPQFHLAI